MHMFLTRCCLCVLLLAVTGSGTRAEILWSADMETGNLRQWPGIWNSGPGYHRAEATTVLAHSGRYSCAMEIDGRAGVRLAVDEIHNRMLPKRAYYSVWYYFPRQVSVNAWWNVMQWKRATYPYGTGSDPVITLDVDNRSNGNMRFHIYHHVGDDGGYNTDGEGIRAVSKRDIPIRQWVHVEVYYRWSTRRDGVITVWQDGHKIIDESGLITEFDYRDDPTTHEERQFTINHYSSGLTPSRQRLYIDDAVIASARQGPDQSKRCPSAASPQPYE